MPETVEFLKKEEIIKVESFGKVIIQDFNASLEKVYEIGEREKCGNVLVDASKQEATPGISDLFEFGGKLPGDFRFAVITTTNVLRDHKFLETVGKNRGKLIQLFDTYDKAINWLRKLD